MIRSLLNKLNTSKALRQALVLFTLLFPSAAWGEEYVTNDSPGSSWGIVGQTNLSWNYYFPYWQMSTNDGSISFSRNENTTGAITISFQLPNSTYPRIGKIISIKIDGTIPTDVVSVKYTKDETPFTCEMEHSNNIYTFTPPSGSSSEWDQIDMSFTENNSTNPSTTYTINSITLTTYTVNNYAFIIAGNPIESGVSGNIQGDGISGTVSYDASSNTLTLNEATITGNIQSNISPLKVHLIGNNTITTSENDAPFEYTGEESTAELTFESSEADDGELTMGGSVREEGSGQAIYLSSGYYKYKNIFGTGESVTTFGDWMIDYPESKKHIYYNPHYGITVGSYEVTKKNKNMITDMSGSDIQYTPNDNVLHIPSSTSFSGTIVKSHRETLNVAINGDCSIKSIHFEEDDAFTAESGTLTIMKDPKSSSAINKLTLNDEENGAISGFSNVTIEEPLMLLTPTLPPDTWGASTKEVVISDVDESNLFGGGNGTEGSPYVLSTANDLKLFAVKYNESKLVSACYVELGDDIDCRGLQGFEPIGTPEMPFIGHFDGAGHKISYLSYDAGSEEDYTGLFLKVGVDGDVPAPGYVLNLTLENCTFRNGKMYNGAIAGILNKGTIDNCTVTSCNILSEALQPSSGGIVGGLYGGSITNCTVSGSTITATSGAGGLAGGIVAYAYGSDNGSDNGSATVSGCQVTGTATNPTTITSSSNYGDDQGDNPTGGIVGYCGDRYPIIISNNKVSGNTTISSIDYYVDTNNFTCAGAIVGDKGNASFSYNYYYYSVTTSTKNGDEEAVERSGYQQRGTGFAPYNYQLQQETEDYDILTNNGAVLYTKLLTMSGETEEGTVMPDNEGVYYADATGGILVAPGQPVKVIVTPSVANGYKISAVSVTYGTDQTAEIELTKTEDGVSYYTITEMPDADATLNVTYSQSYDLWIGDTQVTDDNKDHILGEGNTTVTFAVTGNEAAGYVNTLTLNGAALTVPVKVGLANLTIDIQGSNTITTNTTCIQNTATTGTPSLTFKSTSDVVGSLTLKNNDEDYTGVISESFYSNNTSYYTISRELALIMLRYGNYTSNTYYFTAGEVHNAQIVPSYGVQVESAQILQVYEGNANDILGDGTDTKEPTVSFDKTTNTLTLNGASGISNISTTLNTLNIELVGSNSLFLDSNGSIFESSSGEAVTINLKSTGTAKSSLTIGTENTNPYAKFKGDNVTLTAVEPLVLLTGNLADNKGTLVYGTILAPTITSSATLEGDAITIESDIEDAVIYYSWSADDNEGTSYSVTAPTAKTGTLYAWIKVTTENGTFSSNKTTKEFTVKKDIASCTVTLTENATYTGSKYEPVVKESAAATTPLSLGTDYTVSYQKVEGETATDIESMIDAGTYKITITGAGDFGGTKEVANFQIGQADFSNVTIEGIQNYEYTGEDIVPTNYTVKLGKVTIDATEYTTSLSDNIDVGTATLTLKSAGINFIAYNANENIGYKKITFEISPAPVTITAENQEVTYNTTAQEYDISKVVVDNENAKVVVTYYATAEDRGDEENALTGAPTDAGTYYVRVTLNEESQQHYVAEPADKTFTINQLSLEGAKITLNYTELTYNGSEQTVSVTKVEVNGIVVDSDNYLVDGNKGTEAGEYTVTVTAKPDNDNFKNNFVGSAEKVWKINHRTASATELGFESETQTSSTYYNPNESFNLPEGYVGYIITGINGTEVLTTRVSYIPKGVAVLVEKGTSSDEATENITNTDLLPLKGTVEPLDVISITGGTVYVLYNGEFVKSTSGTIPGKRCYLLIESTVAAGTRAFGINHSNGSTGINALLNDSREMTNDNWFDLQGRRLPAKPTKSGLYLNNGHKVVIK
jgi:hypothetical protein